MGPACWLALGWLVTLAAQGQARLVREDEAGFGDCDGFFYAGAAPTGRFDDAVKLCQRSGGTAHFATLYSTRHRAPLYSAFRAPEPAAPAAAQRWLLEPQIDDPDSDQEEAVDEQEAVAAGGQLGRRQALSADYAGTEFERGQLYPWPLGGDAQEAALALTNAVPMSAGLRERWHGALRELLRRALLPQCGAGLFVLAGAVPSERSLGGRVAVPELLWLAACCAAPGGWAMGFVQQPEAGAAIEDVMLRDLQALLPAQPQLFRDNCGESEQDTEKMKKILEAVTQLQEEARAQGQGGPQPPPASTPPPPPPPQEAEEAGSWLGTLVRLLGSVAVGALRAVLHLLWFVVRLVVQAVEDGLYRLGAAAASYVLAIGAELAGVPWKVLQVLLRVLRALLRILCCLLKAVCRVLGLPGRVLLDVAAFPVYTVGAIPSVCRDIAVGLGGTVALLFNTASGTVGGLVQVVFGVCRRLGARNPHDSSGDL